MINSGVHLCKYFHRITNRKPFDFEHLFRYVIRARAVSKGGVNHLEDFEGQSPR